jgi:predicted transcriptional regulator
MEKKSLGTLELEVLQFVTDHPALTVREVAQQFGEPRGLARTTILTVMENLRAKGYLSRAKENKVFQYSPRVEKPELMRSLMSDFVENTLKGSVSTVVAYLAGSSTVSDAELSELEDLVAKLRSEREGRDTERSGDKR